MSRVRSIKRYIKDKKYREGTRFRIMERSIERCQE